ncbi:copper amine oxidase N-terminal domain-containing protein [Brevibacillus sp. H7]|uniref:copper amine oxidase N-terminal domain-containing protein n=1 Tax=Brevibacillus sp. H7 TaxID=3349138 RepID=UPI003800DDEB
MLRKMSALLLTTTLLTGGVAANAAFAHQAKPVQVNQTIKVMLNGKPFVFPQDPVSYQGVTYVNASTLAIALGGTAAWDTMSKSVLIAKGEEYALRIFADNQLAYKNGKLVQVPAVARPTTGAVLVPLVFVAQELGAKVTLDPKTKTYQITLKIEK